jgi:hypothetical protein
MCEKLRATRQCSSIKDIFAPIQPQALRETGGSVNPEEAYSFPEGEE